MHGTSAAYLSEHVQVFRGDELEHLQRCTPHTHAEEGRMLESECMRCFPATPVLHPQETLPKFACLRADESAPRCPITSCVSLPPTCSALHIQRGHAPSTYNSLPPFLPVPPRPPTLPTHRGANEMVSVLGMQHLEGSAITIQQGAVQLDDAHAVGAVGVEVQAVMSSPPLVSD